jgi:hypothetical protein
VLIVFLVVPVRAQQSIFTTQAPQNPVDTDNAAGEYGMVFASSVPGQITGVRYWKSSSDTGTHTGRLWRVSDRALLATVTFSGGSSTGWQTQSFPSPVTISANTQYLVTVSTPRYYGFTQAGLASTITNGPLSTMVGGNGLYGLTLGAYPTLSWNNSNYFRDTSDHYLPQEHQHQLRLHTTVHGCPERGSNGSGGVVGDVWHSELFGSLYGTTGWHLVLSDSVRDWSK